MYYKFPLKHPDDRVAYRLRHTPDHASCLKTSPLNFDKGVVAFLPSNERQRVVVLRLADARRYAPTQQMPFDLAHDLG